MVDPRAMMHQDYPDPLEFVEELRPITPEVPRERRESYLPIGKRDLVTHLSSDPDLTDDDREQFRNLCQMLDATLHGEFHRRLEEIKSLYTNFDPDTDVKPLAPLNVEDQDSLAPEVFEQIAHLMERANFRRMTTEEIEAAVEGASDWGMKLHVDFNRFERLMIFSRGDVIGRKIRRRWQRFYRPERVEVPTYQRLAILFRLKMSDSEAHEDISKVYLKLFKNVPKFDVDMLLPGTRVRMSWWDQCRIALPTITGFGMALFKILKGAVILAFVGVYGFLALLGFVGGTLGYGVRAFMGYLQTKDRYQLNLTRSLYFQNLATNSGVLFRLLDEAEEQEFREALLAYYVLWRKSPPEGFTREQIDQEVEDYLLATIQVNVDFEIADALNKLVRLQMIESHDRGCWRAVPPGEVLRRLQNRRGNV